MYIYYGYKSNVHNLMVLDFLIQFIKALFGTAVFPTYLAKELCLVTAGEVDLRRKQKQLSHPVKSLLLIFFIINFQHNFKQLVL